MARLSDTSEPPIDYERVIQRIQEAKRGFDDEKVLPLRKTRTSTTDCGDSTRGDP